MTETTETTEQATTEELQEALHDVTIENVFIPEERVIADRPYDVLDPPLQVIASIAFSIILGVYLGVAESARDYAIASVSKPADPSVQRQVGLMNNRLQVAASPGDHTAD